MAHLWVQGAGGWEAQKLDAARFALRADAASEAEGSRAGSPGDEETRLIHATQNGSQTWALLTPRGSHTRVNGREVLAGLCVLADRDEIRTGDGERRFFSTETLAAVEAFPPSDRVAFCGRCRQQIEAGSPAVCCPGCGVWYNQSAELPCWTYSEKCSFCGHPTPLDTGFTWIPEE
jgi:hypothetical protein